MFCIFVECVAGVRVQNISKPCLRQFASFRSKCHRKYALMHVTWLIPLGIRLENGTTRVVLQNIFLHRRYLVFGMWGTRIPSWDSIAGSDSLENPF